MRSVAIGILVDAGSALDPAGKSGLAHLTEHLMFQGTSNRDERAISRIMDSAGGRVGAFTSRDYTCFFSLVLDEHITYVLDLMGDVLLNSIFPLDRLEREKMAILREIDGANDSPRDRAHMLLKSLAWRNHPLGDPIAGFPDTVTGIERDDVIYFVHERYLPNKFVIAAAGNVTHEDFVAQTRDSFWRLLGQAPAVSPRTSPIHQAGVYTEEHASAQVYFSLGLPAYAFHHPLRYATHILSKTLGGGISSRLYRQARENRGLVYQIGSEYHAYRDAGMLAIEGSTNPESLMEVLALILRELEALARGERPIDEEELWKAKMLLSAEHLIECDQPYSRMSRILTQELYFGRHISSEEVVAEIEATESEGLKRMVESTLANFLSNIAVVTIGPESPSCYTKDGIQEFIGNSRGSC